MEQIAIYSEHMEKYGYKPCESIMERWNSGLRCLSICVDEKHFTLYPPFASSKIYNFNEVFGNVKKFKTEGELIKHMSENLIAVNTRTEIEFNCFFELLDRNGIVWVSDSPAKYLTWSSYYSSIMCFTLYCICDKEYCGKITRGTMGWHKEHDYKIISFEELYDMLE